MFNRGLDALLTALPSLADLAPQDLRRLLTGAWLDAVDRRDLGGTSGNRDDDGRIRRLATALAVRILLIEDLPAEQRRACAFIAAECLGIAREMEGEPNEFEPWALGSGQRFELVEEALLYLIAGYDANAALTAAALATVAPPRQDPERSISEWSLSRIRALLDFQRQVPADSTPEVEDGSVRGRVRHELWRRIGDSVGAHVLWLKMRLDEDPQAAQRLRELIRELERQPDDVVGAAAHADLHLLCILLAAACDETSERALRQLPSPPDDGGRFDAYQRRRANRMPLLWPAAADYAARALPGPSVHAVVSVPTGAGKSAVAELAIAQAVRDGWVLYLAPTNALVAQARRDLTRSIGSLEGVQVRDFLGGAEYTQLEGEALGVIADSNVLVMTPEKCSLALRQNPDAFNRLSLCVMDEAHLIAATGRRGVVAELVVAEVLHRSPEARVLMLSALVENPAELSSWLQNATGRQAISVDRPWRPTRTLRALAGLAAEPTARLRATARTFLAGHPKRTGREVDSPLRLLAALHGAWSGEDPADYAIVDTGLTTTARVLRNGSIDHRDHTAPTTRVLVQALAEHDHRVLAFLPGDRHAPFSYARELVGIPNQDTDLPRADVDALLTLADAEIGGPARAQEKLSAVHSAIEKSIAVHSGAMLPYEQRASEIAFERGVAVVMLATGTLAQGLNLPATAVVVGGTSVGDRRQANTPEGRARTRSQLLNAIGRAGRAQIAARSVSIVVPNSPVQIAAEPDVRRAKAAAKFLENEDAAVVIGSGLDDFIERSLKGTLDMQTMAVTEQTAFAFLSFTGETGDAEAVLRRTYAAHRARVTEDAEAIAGTLRILGTSFLANADAPSWIATAAHRAGVTLPVATELHRVMRTRLEAEAAPESVEAWAMWLIQVLAEFARGLLDSALAREPWQSTAVQGIHSQAADVSAPWGALANTMASWLGGEPLTHVGAALHASTAPISPRRFSGDAMPRVVRALREGFEFDLTALAGALVAIVATGAEEDSANEDGGTEDRGDEDGEEGIWAISAEAQRTLALLPLGVRFGAGSPESIALMRAGVRPRVLAHLLASRIPVPEGSDDAELWTWASTIVQSLEDPAFLDSLAQSDAERELFRAAAYVTSVL